MSAESKRTENKSARSRATANKGGARKTTDRAKADAQDRATGVSSGDVGETTAPVHSSLAEAAKAAAAEAKAAGVSPVAVMKSAPEGYASGTGEKVQLIGQKDGPAVEERTTPTQDNKYPEVKKDPPHPKELSLQK